MSNTKNMVVTKAGYKYIGHFGRGYLEIILENGACGVNISPKDEFKLYDLFRCFDIDVEDGKWLHDLEGKCCRVTFDENRRVKMIQHIWNDAYRWSEEKKGADNEQRETD